MVLERYTKEETTRVLSTHGKRLAFSVRELAELLGVNHRRLAELLDEKGVPTFWLGNRRMVRQHIVQKILSGAIDVGRPPQRVRDEAGLIVGTVVSAN